MEALKHGASPPAVRIPTFFTFFFIIINQDCSSSGHENHAKEQPLASARKSAVNSMVGLKPCQLHRLSADRMIHKIVLSSITNPALS
jgi:hypothetical protein